MSQLKIITLDTVQSVAIEWLSFPYFAYGKISFIDGDPGCGKSTFIIHQIANLSCGKLLTPDGVEEGYDPINIVYQNGEDGLDDTIVPRLESAGADRSRIHVIDESDKALTLSDERIEQTINEKDAKLFVIDPFQAYIGDKVDLHRANETRVVMRQLGAVGERTGCAIVLIRHTTKGVGGNPLHRGLGSIDLVGAARSVLLIGRVPDNPSIRGIVQSKNNLAAEGEPMAFQFSETGFEWLGAYDVTADELLSTPKSGSKRIQAEALINKLLDGGKSIMANEIFEKGKAIGVSRRTMENVKSELGIKSERIGYVWCWKK